MSQVINIRFTQEAIGTFEEFIDGWKSIGSSNLISEHFYELHHDDESRPLCVSLEEGNTSIQIEGYTSEASWVFIEHFSESNNGEIFYEGAPLPDEGETTETKLSFFGAIFSVGGIIILVVLWPFMLIYALLRLFFTIVISRK